MFATADLGFDCKKIFTILLGRLLYEVVACHVCFWKPRLWEGGGGGGVWENEACPKPLHVPLLLGYLLNLITCAARITRENSRSSWQRESSDGRDPEGGRRHARLPCTIM